MQHLGPGEMVHIKGIRIRQTVTTRPWPEEVIAITVTHPNHSHTVPLVYLGKIVLGGR